jgi:hypothetical protein
MSVGNNLILSYLIENKPEKFLTLDANYLNAETEKETYEFCMMYYRDLGKLPPVSLVATRFKLDVPEGESQFWESEFSKVRLSLIYERSISKINAFIFKGDTPNATAEISKLAHEVHFMSESSSTITRGEALEELFGTILLRRGEAGLIGIPTGYPTINSLTNGFVKKNVYIMVARMKMGKTMILAYMAEAAFRAGKKVLVMSMEMGKEEYFTRVMSLISRIPSYHLFKGEICNIEQSYLQDLVSDKTRESEYIFQEGFLKTGVSDLGFLIQLHKPDIVFIDGAYLLRIPGSLKMPVWEKATEIISQIKILAGKHDVPIVGTYQFNRQGSKGKGTTEDIHHSDAIGQIASTVLALFDIPGRPDMKKLEVIANRNGACGYSNIMWDWRNADFHEIEGFDDNISISDERNINISDLEERNEEEQTPRSA